MRSGGGCILVSLSPQPSSTPPCLLTWGCHVNPKSLPFREKRKVSILQCPPHPPVTPLQGDHSVTVNKITGEYPVTGYMLPCNRYMGRTSSSWPLGAAQSERFNSALSSQLKTSSNLYKKCESVGQDPAQVVVSRTPNKILLIY